MNKTDIEFLSDYWALAKPWVGSITKSEFPMFGEQQMFSEPPACSALAYKNLIFPQNQELTAPHLHDHYEIIYCKGQGDVSYMLDSKLYALQRNDLIFIPPRCLHQPAPQNLKFPVPIHVFWMTADFLSALLAHHPEYSVFLRTPAGVFHTKESDRQILDAWFLESFSHPKEVLHLDSNAVLSGKTIQFLNVLGQALLPFDAAKSPKKQILSDEISAYIDTHLSEKISLTDTAKAFLISKSSLSQIVREEWGISFYQYVILRRLKAAKKMISNNEPLETVAIEVGFSDYSTFFRSFKKEYGISPSQYQKFVQKK